MKNYDYEQAMMDIIFFDGETWVIASPNNDTGVQKPTAKEKAVSLALEEENAYR
ncbi:MAG: hypothetical protein LUH18_04265 [Oscillospiraceae bacterium]|nr:hypothetical protein [Oscillospiraceae bacterium]